MAEREDSEEEEPKIPATILTGFLGAGKTTLVNHILKDKSHGIKFAIIENEFGDVSVDDAVIKQTSEEDVIEMMNGCICCTVRGDLAKVLERLLERLDDGELKFDAVLIETTGMADPAPVAQTFLVDPLMQARFSLDGIITVVDAKHIVQHLDDKKPEGITNESVEQIAFADRVLLNKLDLVDDAEVKYVTQRIKAINKGAQILKSTNSVVDPKELLNIQSFDLDRILANDPDFLDVSDDDHDHDHDHGNGHDHDHGKGHDHDHGNGHDHHDHKTGENGDGHQPKKHKHKHQHDESVKSVSCVLDFELNVNKLEELIQELLQTKSNDLFRYKGVLAVKGCEEQFVFQGVHMLFSGGFGTRLWKEDEKRASRFVFIGRNLDKDELQGLFEECRAQDAKDLRYQIGDHVYVNLDDEWIGGTVVAHWVKGHPYEVEVDEGLKDECIFGPFDDETSIRDTLPPEEIEAKRLNSEPDLKRPRVN